MLEEQYRNLYVYINNGNAITLTVALPHRRKYGIS
jgi:hypothetical protein